MRLGGDVTESIRVEDAADGKDGIAAVEALISPLTPRIRDFRTQVLQLADERGEDGRCRDRWKKSSRRETGECKARGEHVQPDDRIAIGAGSPEHAELIKDASRVRSQEPAPNENLQLQPRHPRIRESGGREPCVKTTELCGGEVALDDDDHVDVAHCGAERSLSEGAVEVDPSELGSEILLESNDDAMQGCGNARRNACYPQAPFMVSPACNDVYSPCPTP